MSAAGSIIELVKVMNRRAHEWEKARTLYENTRARLHTALNEFNGSGFKHADSLQCCIVKKLRGTKSARPRSLQSYWIVTTTTLWSTFRTTPFAQNTCFVSSLPQYTRHVMHARSIAKHARLHGFVHTSTRFIIVRRQKQKRKKKQF